MLDFDGVMAAHGAKSPEKEVSTWLKNLMNECPGIKFYILSNNPWTIRLQFFKTHFPEIQFVSNVRKKPYPDGMLKISKLSGISAENIAIVDDRLLTGCLAAEIAGCKAIWIYKPYVDYKQHRLQELFFQILRFIEKRIF